MKHFITLLVFIFSFVFWGNNLKAQCVITSASCGYTVRVNITPIAIIPSATPCPFGYNYNVRFNYTLIVTGVNTCFNGTIGVQPQIICSGQNNGYFTITVPAPTVGAASTSTTYTGTLTTSTNPFRSITDCATATPTSLGCNSLQITVFGPGIPTTTITCAAGPLAIGLTNFSAAAQENISLLKWNTSYETNNKTFVIEHSKDGINFSTVGEVKGKGNSSYTSTYSFTHYNPINGKNYYRLKSIDVDGKFSYSVVVVTLNEFSATGLSVYPRVTKNNFIIQTATNEPIQLFNICGQLIKFLKMGENNIMDLPAGLYIVKQGIKTVKLIKE
ncbi:MAG: T9SS type A sorting domain-containing protein [Chitinophagaceae bacterium]|nr:T9SS type A sorting domain-containing protein [Chitinophagaceae bacterium]